MGEEGKEKKYGTYELHSLSRARYCIKHDHKSLSRNIKGNFDNLVYCLKKSY